MIFLTDDTLDGDISLTTSGDITQPLTHFLSDSFEGQVNINYQGVDELDAAIEEASETLQMDVNEQDALQSTQSGQTVSTEQQGTDWKQSDNTQLMLTSQTTWVALTLMTI
ncbi:hypothetical protein [Vibrio mediterranei]|uniref:hypothetical protein n=1 Tax=Vibrio mediterranei TaxID=689 RepID=UPI001EFEDC62|nr:hypothetical protein [Vibrio mediterranei]MCG9661372.1 hypothetical protein [Vibrio mediterranei]